MKLEKIVSLANKKSELRFLAMVRSLRQTGCNLPVWVIPYDDNKFDLPENCIWWEMEDVILWLSTNNAHPMMRKYQCLLTTNYQYVDSDIVFLRNPEMALENFTGFITSCGHWHNPNHTYVDTTIKLYKAKSTTWQKSVFNAGQYACDIQLFDFNALKAIVEDQLHKEICLSFRTFDQVALNLLVHLSCVTVTNITMPPWNMESTWAGDYTDEDYARYWTNENKTPYIIHWAGCNMDTGRPINSLFTDVLTKGEKQEWFKYLDSSKKSTSNYKRVRRYLSLLKQAIKSVNFS
jgi:hypothetical protein